MKFKHISPIDNNFHSTRQIQLEAQSKEYQNQMLNQENPSKNQSHSGDKSPSKERQDPDSTSPKHSTEESSDQQSPSSTTNEQTFSLSDLAQLLKSKGIQILLSFLSKNIVQFQKLIHTDKNLIENLVSLNSQDLQVLNNNKAQNIQLGDNNKKVFEEIQKVQEISSSIKQRKELGLLSEPKTNKTNVNEDSNKTATREDIDSLKQYFNGKTLSFAQSIDQSIKSSFQTYSKDFATNLDKKNKRKQENDWKRFQRLEYRLKHQKKVTQRLLKNQRILLDKLKKQKEKEVKNQPTQTKKQSETLLKEGLSDEKKTQKVENIQGPPRTQIQENQSSIVVEILNVNVQDPKQQENIQKQVDMLIQELEQEQDRIKKVLKYLKSNSKCVHDAGNISIKGQSKLEKKNNGSEYQEKKKKHSEESEYQAIVRQKLQLSHRHSFKKGQIIRIISIIPYPNNNQEKQIRKQGPLTFHSNIYHEDINQIGQSERKQDSVQSSEPDNSSMSANSSMQLSEFSESSPLFPSSPSSENIQPSCQSRLDQKISEIPLDLTSQNIGQSVLQQKENIVQSVVEPQHFHNDAKNYDSREYSSLDRGSLDMSDEEVLNKRKGLVCLRRSHAIEVENLSWSRCRARRQLSKSL